MIKEILIVEDEPSNMKLLSSLLQRIGYETIEATNGERGVELAMASPDLILMDIMIPKMDGIQAMRIIKANNATKYIPILAITAKAMAGDREGMLEIGFDGYIAKPFDIEELLRVVARFCRDE